MYLDTQSIKLRSGLFHSLVAHIGKLASPVRSAPLDPRLLIYVVEIHVCERCRIIQQK
jgi:hypothetical protein